MLGLSFCWPGEFEHLRRWVKPEEDRPEEAVPVYRREGGLGTQHSTSSTVCMGFLSYDINAKNLSYLGSTRLGLDASLSCKARELELVKLFISFPSVSLLSFTEVTP